MRGYNTVFLVIVPTIIVAVVSTVGLVNFTSGKPETINVQGNGNFTTIEALMKGNVEFVNRPLFKEAREKTSEGQHPVAVVVTCSDSRVSPELLFQQNLGQLFVIRTAGELVDSLEIGSIEYAVEHLHVPLIIVLGHNNCGAVQAYINHAKPEGDLKKVVDMIAAEVEVKNLEAKPNTKLQDFIEANILHNSNSIYQRSKVVREKFINKEVQIVSAIYDLESGEVNLLSNINNYELLP